jgi:DNA-binding response OmpR family regulator
MAGYQVIVAGDGEEALKLFRDPSASFALIISDLTMPRLDGEGLLREVRKTRSTVPFLFTSGYPTDHVTDPGGTPVAILEKPWTVADLTARVRELVDQPPT